MLGSMSEDNPPVQVVPTPTPLVPHFQVLVLDLLKVLQQLCVVNVGRVSFLGLGGSLQTVSVETSRELSVSVCMGPLGGPSPRGSVSHAWEPLPCSQS